MAGKSDAQRVNHLYWETESSVSEIADAMGMSRRALYELIEPLPAGAECESCGAELYFANRSAKGANAGRCLMCGNERTLAEEEPLEPYHFDRPRDIWPYVIIGAAAFGIIATLLIRRHRR